MYGAGGAGVTASGRPQRSGEWPPRGRALGARHARLLEEAHHVAIQVPLLDDLWRTYSVEFGRAIRGDHEKGNKRQVSFGHRGVQLRRGGATGDDYGNGQFRRQGATESKESRAAFIETNVESQLASRGHGQGERSRARSRAEDYVTKSETQPLIKERGGKRGLSLVGARYAT